MNPVPAKPEGLDDAAALPCAACGYDLRAHPPEGICPECATPVQKAIELAAVPRRPAWRDSDPRWRRRMLAGAWIMVLIPVVPVLWTAWNVPVPALFEYGSSFRPIHDTYLPFVFAYLVFCIGIVLFFSKERGRREYRLDWTRRWGVIASYLVLLLGVPVFATVTALVVTGIAALFLAMSPAHQPAIIDLLIALGTGWLRYAPMESGLQYTLLAGAYVSVILFACLPIYNALRSSGPTVLALVIVASLAAISVLTIGHSMLVYLGLARNGLDWPSLFFAGSDLPAYAFARLLGLNGDYYFYLSWFGASVWNFVSAAARWLLFLSIAIWLSIAQARAWRKARLAK